MKKFCLADPSCWSTLSPFVPGFVMHPYSDGLIDRLTEASNRIYELTDRSRANFIEVVVGSPFHRAVLRGEFRELGIDQDAGFEIRDGVIRFDAPAPSAIDQLAALEREPDASSDAR
jgi:hypothetical protein